MNSTIMWIETVILMWIGIVVIPVLIGATRQVAGAYAGMSSPFAAARAAVAAWRRLQRDPGGGRRQRGLHVWRCPPGIPGALYQYVV